VFSYLDLENSGLISIALSYAFMASSNLPSFRLITLLYRASKSRRLSEVAEAFSGVRIRIKTVLNVN